MAKNNKAKYMNSMSVEGLLYDNKLEERVTGAQSKKSNTPYLTGTVDIATNSERTNVVSVYFSYVPSDSKIYPILKNIANGVLASVMKNNADEAVALRIGGNVEINEWYSDKQLDDKGQPTLTSTRRARGSFIDIISRDSLMEDEEKRGNFMLDMLISSATKIEANEERGYPEKVKLKGWIFNYKEEMFPVEFTVLHPEAMDYFISVAPNQKDPLFTRVKGHVISMTTKVKQEVEGAFSTEIVEYTRTNKDWIVDFSAKEPYNFNDEGVLGFEDVRIKIANREEYLAELKHRYEENKKKKAQSNPLANMSAAGGLDYIF